MIRSSLLILAILTLSLGAAAQNRVFDNFDRSQGVNVYLPPQPEPQPVARRVKKNGRWMVVTEDPLVKNEGYIVQAKTRFSASGFYSNWLIQALVVAIKILIHQKNLRVLARSLVVLWCGGIWAFVC